MKKTALIPIILFLLTSLVGIVPALFSHSPSKMLHLHKSKIQSGDVYLTVYNTALQKTEYVNVEEYLPGVLAAEMPASYEIEALKAQAVAARSYIFYKLNTISPEHPDVAVCDNPSHCKAYISKADFKTKWPKADSQHYWSKLVDAVDATRGEYMVCGNEVVEAFFFAQSGGRTENSEEVWGESRPYLKSVESPENPAAQNNLSTTELTFTEFRKLLNAHNPKIAINNSSPVIGKTSRTQGQSVKAITIDNVPFTGKELRTIFGLKSANFTITTSQNSVIFSVIGYGHGVGMSQAGANEMAKNGENYTEILSHYYTNIQIMKI